MEQSGFITLVIHSSGQAVALKQLLESHGIVVSLEDLLLDQPSTVNAIKVLVKASDIPLALKILESGINYSASLVEMKMSGKSGNILIPVDLSDYSNLACEVGLDFAKRLSLHAVVMHSFRTKNLRDHYTVAEVSSEVSSLSRKQIAADAESKMHTFASSLRKRRAASEVADVKFSTILKEGIPEDIILEYARQSPPELIVMATRSRSKKMADMVGSVSAEVIDSCRVPVFTVPEDYVFPGVKNIRKLLFICNLDKQDLLSIEALMRMFDYPEIEMTIIPAADIISSSTETKLTNMISFLNDTYRNAKFASVMLSSENYSQDLQDYINTHSPELLLVPNRKKNIFSRIFNPSIAHRILFERDMPMLVIPV